MERNEFVDAAVRCSMEMYDRDVERGLPTLKVGEPLSPEAPVMLHMALQFAASKAVPNDLAEAISAEALPGYLDDAHVQMLRLLQQHLRNQAETIDNILGASHADEGDS